MKTEQKNQRVVVKFLPATDTKGARFSVKGEQGRKILSFDYSARNPEEAAAYQYLVLTTGEKKWSLMEYSEAGNRTDFYAYSVCPVEIIKHKSIVEDYSWTR
jgi:hypothetical protein